MDIELLYLTGCPNLHLARERLDRALDILGRPGPEVRPRAVGTEQEARDLRFAGSPTIRVDGRDLFAAPGPAAPVHGLTCRVYPTPDGLDGAPTVDQIVRALTDAL